MKIKIKKPKGIDKQEFETAIAEFKNYMESLGCKIKIKN